MRNVIASIVHYVDVKCFILFIISIFWSEIFWNIILRICNVNMAHPYYCRSFWMAWTIAHIRQIVSCNKFYLNLWRMCVDNVSPKFFLKPRLLFSNIMGTIIIKSCAFYMYFYTHKQLLAVWKNDTLPAINSNGLI